MGSEGFGGKIYGPSPLSRITRIESFRWDAAFVGIHSKSPLLGDEDRSSLKTPTHFYTQ